MQHKTLGVLVYVVASNHLAGEYLQQLLTSRFARPILCEQLPQPRIKSQLTVFVIDASAMPLPLGRCLQRLRSLFQKARILVVAPPQPNDELLRLLRLGIHGFVDHLKVAQLLCDAAETVARGHLYFPQELLHTYVESTFDHNVSHLGQMRVPTPRETEVLELVGQRLSNKEIARALKIEEGTVKYHLSKIMSKLHVCDRRELVKKTPVPRIWGDLAL